MGTETLSALRNKTTKKSEHFTGIGINNVDDRIKLIYGMDYGINIVSEKKREQQLLYCFQGGNGKMAIRFKEEENLFVLETKIQHIRF